MVCVPFFHSEYIMWTGVGWFTSVYCYLPNYTRAVLLSKYSYYHLTLFFKTTVWVSVKKKIGKHLGNCLQLVVLASFSAILSKTKPVH